MALYASESDLLDYLADSPELTAPGGEAAERLLERAEREVDRALGPWPILSTGRKLDPALLDLVQRAAVARATCAAAEHLLLLDPATLAGDDDYVPNEVTVLRRAQRVSPKMLAELSGHGLVRYSGTVVTPVEVVRPAPASLLGPYTVQDGVLQVGPPPSDP